LLKDRSAWELAHVPMAETPAEEAGPAHLPEGAFSGAALLGA
jgi:hypothetical protein